MFLVCIEIVDSLVTNAKRQIEGKEGRLYWENLNQCVFNQNASAVRIVVRK